MQDFKTPGVYKITNTETGQIYIGSTKENIHKRCKRHKYQLTKNTHGNLKLQNSWNKYGEFTFKFEVVENIEDLDLVLDREQYWIDTTGCLDTKKGFNISKKATHPNPRKISKKDKVSGILSLHKDGYLVTFPNGLIMHVNNLSEFEKEWMEEYNLCRGGLSNVARGRQTNHKEFLVQRANPEHRVQPKQLIFQTRPNTHVVFDPQGKRYEINNLSQFCKDENLRNPNVKLHHTGLVQVSQEQYRHTQGYICYKIENAPISYQKPIYTEYGLRSPSGENHRTFNLKEFSSEQNLSYSQLIKVSSPSAPNKTYKGWYCIKIQSTFESEMAAIKLKPTAKGRPRKTIDKGAFIVTYPDGKETQVTNLAKFTKENNLGSDGLACVARGKQATHRGFKCRRELNRV